MTTWAVEAAVRAPSPEHLRQMVLQMIDVVAHEVVERHGAIPRHWTECPLIEVGYGAAAHAIRRGRRRHHTREVAVVRQPEHDELRPRRLAVALRPDPRVLLVALDDEIIAAGH